jgi:hypothetical protein
MRKLIVLRVTMAMLASCIPPTPAPAGPCEISAPGAVVYMLPSAGSAEFGIMDSATYEATAKTADGFYGFDPGVAQGGNMGIYRLRWVLKTHDVSTSPGCASIPTVVGPIDGLCYAMIMADTPVYTSADTVSAVITTLVMGDFVMVTGHDTNWLSLDLNVGSENTDNVGFIDDGLIGGLKGECGGF